ncbi:TylF/MycF family methyltransferase [Litorilinea aerophila]|uniref:Asparagine synthase n=1 Tax=Litorilinea aerophila TaxID=1204385 RepID=A0A540VD73_9CHLR|nr:TylF/MycF/NovP-related O-methyltransferase [Litorilinea aerophila]MCC9077579.1 TylF/MycF family methyltransferase [Litorilinea aerophila]
MVTRQQVFLNYFRSFPQGIHHFIHWAKFFLKDPIGFSLLKRIRAERLTYLDMSALIDLYETVKDVESRQIPGVLIEAGTALGGSAIVMAAAKHSRRPLLIFDAFETIPPPSERDGQDAHQRYALIQCKKAVGLKGTLYYGYRTNLIAEVKHNFARFGYPVSIHQVSLVQGYYEETLYVDQAVALAHIDCDWYDSVMTCLERIVPYLSVGGRLIIDDYAHWSGCRQAVDDYFANRQQGFQFIMKSRLHILRV